MFKLYIVFESYKHFQKFLSNIDCFSQFLPKKICQILTVFVKYSLLGKTALKSRDLQPQIMSQKKVRNPDY